MRGVLLMMAGTGLLVGLAEVVVGQETDLGRFSVRRAAIRERYIAAAASGDVAAKRAAVAELESLDLERRAAEEPALRRGSEGETVRLLQDRLSRLGYDVAVDGDFGRRTEEALGRYQRDRGLTVDGKAGPETWHALGVDAAAAAIEEASGSVAVDTGTDTDTGTDERVTDPVAPDSLSELGLGATASDRGAGRMGRAPSVEAGLLAGASGQGPTSPSATEASLDLERTLRRGSKGEDVERLQRFLGLADDGDFGPATEDAVRAWQEANGLSPDGVVGRRTAAAMEGEDRPASDPGDRTLSGRDWVRQFPTSHDTADLTSSFGEDVDAFLGALRSAGANVRISATLRPPERAYLMHYAFRIAREGLDPRNVPDRAGVDIRWVHTDAGGRYDAAASRQAARDMVAAYNIAFRPSLNSLHTEGRAIDMTITWSGTLEIVSASGETVRIGSPRNGGDNRALHRVGAGYGVRKLVPDRPHWSDNGH